MQNPSFNGIISWLLFGILAGAVAKLLIPKGPRSLVGLTVIGVVGSLFGGWLATLLGYGGITGFDFRSLVISIVGAIITLALYVVIEGRISSAKAASFRQPRNAPPSHSKERPNLPKPAPQRKILFISYRRSDSSDITGRLYDRLESRFGRECVFKDVDSIPLGVDFRQYIDRMVTACSAMVVVIGRRWLGHEENDTGLRTRIQDSNDFVRIEIETALKRDIPIVPILVQGATMPPEEALPPSLRDLRYRNGIPLRPDPDFHMDIQRLINALETHLK